MVVDNWTNITAGGFMLFESAQGDFSFDIGYSDSILVSTRNVTTENATTVTTLDYNGRDNEGYSTSRDGSWELCDGVWDYNEPDEMTPNATNACAGEPLVLSTLGQSGSWTDNPETIASGTSTLGWNTSNLHPGQSYYLYYSWYTDLGNSHSRGITFTADGSYIEFDLSSHPDWTCEIRVDAYVRNQTNSVTIEYFDEHIDVDCGEKITDFELTSVGTYVQDGDFVGTGAMDGGAGFNNGKLGRTYRSTLVISFDGEVESFGDSTCDFNSKTCFVDYEISVPSSVCEVEFKVTAWVLTPAKWNEVGEYTWGLEGSCDTQSSYEATPFSLYAMMDDGTGGQSWTLMADDGVNDVLDMSTSRTQAFYWDIDQDVVGTDVRLNFYYEGDEAFDEYFTYDGQPIYWNASIAETECSPYVYGYLYQELPDGSNGQMGLSLIHI